MDPIPSPIILNSIWEDTTTQPRVPSLDIRSLIIVSETVTSDNKTPSTGPHFPPPDIRLSNIVPEMVTSDDNETVPLLSIEEELN